MRNHYEPEILAAFASGDAEPSSRAQIDGHVGYCDDCREIVDAVRATMIDLADLSEEEPTELERAALRRALAQRRHQPGGLTRRMMTAASAAALVAALAIGGSMVGERNSQDGTGGGAEIASDMLMDSPEIVTDARNFDRSNVGSLLAAPPSMRAAPATKGGPDAEYGVGGDDAGAARIAADPQRCQQIITSTAKRPLALRSGYDTHFEGRPAYIFVFVDTAREDRLELWVVDRFDCENTLYFEQSTSK
ncbi:MAG TPA: hypothetical protein VM600_00155 [Actinomycetota bacterium]|nr:hypothetical protein [Actinomycetota bacterium]